MAVAPLQRARAPSAHRRARRASRLYLTSFRPPVDWVEGEINPSEGEAVLTERTVEALMLDIIPERSRKHCAAGGTEWIAVMMSALYVVCQGSSGAGGISADSDTRDRRAAGLSKEIQGLCARLKGGSRQGPRFQRQSTLIAASST